MAKRRRESDSDGKDAAAVDYGTVFVDTSLDTHLAMLVSNSDTVSDFKKKLVLEHMQCFPKIGEIRIHSMKVKRRANMYHLPDNMLVWSAFHGVQRNWFLSADVSGIPEVGGVDDDCRGLSSDANKIPALPISLQDGVTEKNVVSEITAGVKAEKSLEKTRVSQSNNYSQENHIESESRPKKKRKTRLVEDACHRPSMKDSFPLDNESGKDTSMPKIIACGNPMVDAVKEGQENILLLEEQGKPTMSKATAEVLGVRNSQPDIGDRVAFEGTSSPATENKSHMGSTLNSPNLLGSDKRKEDTVQEGIIPEGAMTSKQECELGHAVPTEHLGYVSNKFPNVPTSLMDASGAMGDVKSDGTGRKKKKAQKTAAKIQDATDVEHTRKGESLKPHTETHKSGRKKEEKGLSPNHDNEVILSSYNKTSDHDDQNSMLKETSTLPHLLDANAVMEPEISTGGRKKRGKKSADTNQDKSGIEQTNNVISGSSGLLCPSTDHIPEETNNEERILYHKGKDVQMKILDISSTDAIEKVPVANRNEADHMISTQTKQGLEDVASENQEVEEKTKYSAGKCDGDIPAKEKENQILEFNQVEKNINNTEDKDKKTKKKRKKRNPIESDIQENLPVKDKKVGVEVSTTKEDSIGFVSTASEARHVTLTHVLSCRSQEKLEEMHGGAADHAGDLARMSEHEGEGINFKQYFVPGQYQDKADSRDRVKKATKSNVEMKNGKKVKDNGLPPVSNSTELQNSVKSLENQQGEKKSRVRKTSGMRPRDSAQNSDREDVIPNSVTRSLSVSEKRMNDSSPSGMLEPTSLQKPNEILAKSSSRKEKNTSLDKSSSKRSETFQEKSGNKMLQSGLSATYKMAMKTPQKKSLFNKLGTIFQENSGESSGDENGAVHSDDSTRSPSSSSSLSSYSVGESDLSQDSTRNGSNDAKGRSTEGKSTSKLDSISASKDMTMDMILKSSKRFKKAKLLLSSQNQLDQHDSLPIDFVPDSQPT